MSDKENCSNCAQANDCKTVYEQLGKATGPSIAKKAVAVFLGPIVVFIVCLVILEKKHRKATEDEKAQGQKNLDAYLKLRRQYEDVLGELSAPIASVNSMLAADSPTRTELDRVLAETVDWVRLPEAEWIDELPPVDDSFVGPLSEAGLRDVDQLVEIIVGRQVPALFVESSVPRRSIEAVQVACRERGHEVSIGGQLFSDAMGTPGTPEGTSAGMVRHNVDTIVNALQ